MVDRTTLNPVYEDETGCYANLAYLHALTLLERLNRLSLEVIKEQLRRLDIVEVTPGQALLLFRIGQSEVTPSEIAARGYYLGSNVSYTLRKLVGGGFLHHRRHGADGRSFLISLTGRGIEVREVIAELLERHSEEMESRGWLECNKLGTLCDSLHTLERFWIEQEMLV